MPYRYVAIFGDGEGPPGLVPRWCTGKVSVFASEETPTVTIPGGGILIGRLFRNDGTPLDGEAQFPALANRRQLRDFVLGHCWGEYVLFQPGTGGRAEVTILRDPSGGVPCVYSVESEPRFATSDISIATGHQLYRKHIDWEFLAHCLVYPYMVTQRTGLSGIRELLPGSLLHVTGSVTATECLWSPWDFVATGRRLGDIDQAAARVRHAVRTATEAWAGIDRSILLELSGGLDSSTLAACLRDTDARVSCCTLLTSVRGADERQYASLVANDLGVPLRVEELGFGLARFDAPPPSWAVSPRINVLQQALNEAMTSIGASEAVASHFSGGGGDTVFCYLGNAAPAADAFRETGLIAGTRAVRELSHLHHCTLWKAARLTMEKLLQQPGMPHHADTSLLSRQVAAIPPDQHPWFEAPPQAFPGDRRRIQLLAGTQLYRHAMSRGALRDLRMPLLSQPVVEACLSAPAWMWIAGGRNRSVARLAFSDALPREVLDRRSKGDFSQYLGAVWQRQKYRMRDFLMGGELYARGLLDQGPLEEFFRRRLPSRDQSFMRIFELCTIENWVRHQR